MIWSSHLNIFPLKHISSFKLNFLNIVAVCVYFSHSYLSNFHNTMHRRKPVGVIRQTSISGSGANEGLEFIRFVGGRQPHIHKLWSFPKYGITREVHSCVTALRIRDARLREHRLVQAQNILYIHHIRGDGLVYWSDDNCDDLWGKRADQ